MFERFTDRARLVIVKAQDESKDFGHTYIGTGHIFLGLLGVNAGIALEALNSCGIQLDDARKQVFKVYGESQRPREGHIPFTPRAKRVLELALRDALQLSHNYIGPEHILLGLTRMSENQIAEIVNGLGTDFDQIRHETLRALVARGESIPTEAWPAVTRSAAEIQAEIDTHTAAIALLTQELGRQRDV